MIYNHKIIAGGTMVNINIGNLKLVRNLQYYFNSLVSGIVNGGSWKIERITELNTREKRRIVIRSMSAYEELFARQEQNLKYTP